MEIKNLMGSFNTVWFFPGRYRLCVWSQDQWSRQPNNLGRNDCGKDCGVEFCLYVFYPSISVSKLRFSILHKRLLEGESSSGLVIGRLSPCRGIFWRATLSQADVGVFLFLEVSSHRLFSPLSRFHQSLVLVAAIPKEFVESGLLVWTRSTWSTWS